MQKKILIINDSESLSEIFQFYLEMKNYQVSLAFNGVEGVEKAKQEVPDLILLDVVMPGIDGFETCRRLKQDPTTAKIPVLFLSALTSTSDKIKGLESGGVDFISNTSDQPEILARIEAHLKISELTQKLQASNCELQLKQKALNEDLYAASIIQQSLLPPESFQKINGVSVAWLCQPSEQIGGDICNIIPFDSGKHIVVYILDVSGHGVHSAMVTVSMTQFLHQFQTAGSPLPPKEVLAILNKEYPFEKFNMFSTLFYLNLDTINGRIVYANAGHHSAVHLSPLKPYMLLESTGPMIGVEPFTNFEEKEVYLQEGDKVFLFTDGIIEFRNDAGEFYGFERFYQLLEDNKMETVNKIIELVSLSLKEFGHGRPPQDDISILGFEFKN